MKTTTTAILALCLCLTGCAAITEIGIGPTGVTFRFNVSAERERPDYSWRAEADDEPETPTSP